MKINCIDNRFNFKNAYAQKRFNEDTKDVIEL